MFCLCICTTIDYAEWMNFKAETVCKWYGHWMATKRTFCRYYFCNDENRMKNQTGNTSFGSKNSRKKSWKKVQKINRAHLKLTRLWVWVNCLQRKIIRITSIPINKIPHWFIFAVICASSVSRLLFFLCSFRIFFCHWFEDIKKHPTKTDWMQNRINIKNHWTQIKIAHSCTRYEIPRLCPSKKKSNEIKFEKQKIQMTFSLVQWEEVNSPCISPLSVQRFTANK